MILPEGFLSMKCRLIGLLLMSFVTLAGCHRSGSAAVAHPVKGVVKIDDVPLAKGTILFTPVDVNQVGGPVSGPIEQGAFSVQVPAGKFNVTFSSGGAVSGGATSESRTQTKNLIPVKYQAGIPVEITGPKNDLAFDLRSL